MSKLLKKYLTRTQLEQWSSSGRRMILVHGSSGRLFAVPELTGPVAGGSVLDMIAVYSDSECFQELWCVGLEEFRSRDFNLLALKFALEENDLYVEEYAYKYDIQAIGQFSMRRFFLEELLPQMLEIEKEVTEIDIQVT